MPTNSGPAPGAVTQPTPTPTSDTILRDRCIDGFRERFGPNEESPLSPQNRQLYRDQLKLELSLIANTGLASRFLAAKMPGDPVGIDILIRGSLVAYLLFFTDVDPIRAGRCAIRPAMPSEIKRSGLDAVDWGGP